jgi:hypothetical protein
MKEVEGEGKKREKIKEPLEHKGNKLYSRERENLVGWNWFEGGKNGGKLLLLFFFPSTRDFFQGVQCQWVLAEAMEQKQKPGLLPTQALLTRLCTVLVLT